MSYQATDTAPRKLELNKSSLQSLTLYAHGLISLSDLIHLLGGEKITISHVSTTFTSDCITISNGIKQTDLFFHLARLSGEEDERGFPINDETCVVNL
ncbi:hypothetical protein JA33_280 [Dickeya phage vB_DsoM_JA33]|uniref:Uncharacterized protein n=3 Tax=Salmondvirus JA11 TaxID=2734141 RepID=A0A384ZWU2_9CAUD|nr:hypothetical protein HOU32_gp279 [Dickeya phage vB_DsoM_JA11]AXG66685.1 hypothetical protein JA13_282 [Dickeya phage vB_DsoM_JA13]AXG67654.1 hypothetical protein JA33_280 [Dickeya phage vB_DsoM_JA33]AYD80084.1 hypothetical protein JA11_279 [Dickeya phage vB_DsoM_JA11]